MASASKTTTLYSNGGHAYTLVSSFVETQVDTTNNTSTLSCTVSLVPINNYWETSYDSSIAVYWHDNRQNTDIMVSALGFKGISQGETKTTTGSITVTHKEDGTLSGYAYATFTKGQTTSSFAPNSGSVATDLTVLTNIDRYPLITSAPNFNDEENPSIVYSTNVGFDNPTTYACISLDGTTDSIAYRQVNIADGGYTFNLTTSERNVLRNATPNSNNLNVTFILKTVVGNDNYYSKVQRQMNIVNANPTFTHSEAETNQNVIDILGSTASSVVQNVSVVQLTITPSALKGSNIASVRVASGTAYLETKTSSPYVFEVPITMTGSMVVTVVDSRGNSNATLITKNLISYNPVSINSFTFIRENSTSSNIILNFEGNYLQTSFGNTPNVPTIQWKLDDGSFTTIPSTNYIIDTTNNKITIIDYELTNALVYTSQGQFSIKLKDLLTEAQDGGQSGYVTKGVPTFDYGEHDLKVNGDLFIADTNGDNAVNVLPLIKPILLWTNPSPNADYGTSTINLSSNDYDMLEFYFKGSPEDSNAMFSIKILKGYGGQVLIEGNGVFGGVNNNSFILRNISYITDTQYKPTYAMYKYGTNSSYNVLNILIPQYVIGYKTGLF